MEVKAKKIQQSQQSPKKKIWTASEIRKKLQENDAWLYRGVLAVYDRQTNDEKTIQHTKYENGIGYSKIDSRFMSSLAEFLKVNGFLTSKQKNVARKKILKYSGQLAKIARGEI